MHKPVRSSNDALEESMKMSVQWRIRESGTSVQLRLDICVVTFFLLLQKYFAGKYMKQREEDKAIQIHIFLYSLKKKPKQTI